MRVFAILLLICGLAFGQSTDAPQFSIADVHASPHNSIAAARGPFFAGGRYEMYYATMVDLIHAAYGVDPDSIYGGPSWLEFDRFDILAMAPPNSTAESRKLMLQSLLADRFKLVLHKDSKPMTAYVLKAGSSPKLQESAGGGAGCNMKIENLPPPGPPPAPGEDRPPMQLPVIVYTCQGTTMAAFAQTLQNAPGANQYFVGNKPLVDQTELKGTFDFTFRYTPKIPPNIAVKGDSMPIFDALEKQLGLKAELSTTPLPVIAVDSVTETPSANPPDVEKSFPPIPTEFDAAEIKPSPPGARGGVMPEIKNGRVLLPGIDLRSLVLVAWDFSPNDNDALVGPKWLNSAHFDIIAKAPAGVALGDLTPSSIRAFPVNIDVLRPMLRNLLTERFKMQVHTEDRPTPAYTLVAVKPKLQKADPNGRTKWTEGPAADRKDPRNSNPALGRLVTCHNMSMAQFAKLLQDIAPGYIHNDVVDATGLEGNWDFTLNFSTAGQLQGGGRSGDGPPSGAPGDSAASDPTGALSLLDALPKQLGLKLEMQKRPLPVLVIDHVEEKPTDN
jgi:uncharacterized protein (TIGR03435 family)